MIDRQLLPKLLSHVRHERMQQPQRLFQNRNQPRARQSRSADGSSAVSSSSKARYTNRRNRPRRSDRALAPLRETLSLELPVHRRGRLVQTRNNPTIVERQSRLFSRKRLRPPIPRLRNSSSRTAPRSKSCWRSFDTTQPAFRSNEYRSCQPAPASARGVHAILVEHFERIDAVHLSSSTCAGRACRESFR